MLPPSEQGKRVFRFLESKGVSPVCPDCGASQWVNGHVVNVPLAPEFEPELPYPPGVDAGALMYYRVCTNCGRAVFYSAMVLGIVGIEDLNNPI